MNIEADLKEVGDHIQHCPEAPDLALPFQNIAAAVRRARAAPPLAAFEALLRQIDDLMLASGGMLTASTRTMTERAASLDQARSAMQRAVLEHGGPVLAYLTTPKEHPNG